MPELTQVADGLHSAKDLFHEFPFPLTHVVALVPRRPAIDRAPAHLLRHVGRDGSGTHGGNEARRWCADAGRPTRFKPSSPSPTDAVRDGSAKLGHPVQNVTREHGLTPLPR